MFAVVAFVSAIWVLKKIWQRLRSRSIVSSFVEQYLSDSKTVTYDKCGGLMAEVDRKRFFNFTLAGKKARTSNRLDQQKLKVLHRFNSSVTMGGESGSLLPLYSQGLISNRLLQRKKRTLRSQSTGELIFDQQKLLDRLRIMGTIEEEGANERNLTSPDGSTGWCQLEEQQGVQVELSPPTVVESPREHPMD